jgi:hypothetical protein
MKTTYTGFVSAVIVALGIASGGSANAQCGSLAAARQANFLPLLHSLEVRGPEAAATPADGPGDPSIVGLWDVKFISNGQLYDEGIDQYHSDGLEIMNDITPPAAGNICLGIWSASRSQVKLNHPFWIFDGSGNLIGRGLLTEQITVASNSYTGVFTFQFRDLSGKPIPSMPDVSGILQASRISAP